MDVLNEGFYTFVIVEMEGGKLDLYNRLSDIAKVSNYVIYGIDLIQPLDVCMNYLKHTRTYRDVEEIIKLISEHPIPYYHSILDPIQLVEPGWKPPTPPPKARSPTPPRRVTTKNRRRYGNSSDDSDESCFVCYG